MDWSTARGEQSASCGHCQRGSDGVLQSFQTLPKRGADNSDPLHRLFFREGAIGQKLLSQVRRDLTDVVKVCEGALKQTNHLRTLMSALTKGGSHLFVFVSGMKLMGGSAGTIPDHWRKYKVHKVMSVSEWIPNLARRLAQLDHISGLDELNNIEVWLGGLFYPEAYITATRQAVAHRKKWSLETLHLQLDLEKVNDPEGFIIDGEDLVLISWKLQPQLRCILQVWCSKGLHGRQTNSNSTKANQCGSTLRRSDGYSQTRLRGDQSISRST